MTPKRIKKRKDKKSGSKATTMTPPMKNPNQGKKKPPVVIKKDSRKEIVKLNQEKLMNDIDEMYNYAKKKGMKNANSGTMGMMKNRAELKMFVDKAKEDGLTNAQALSKFKKQFKL